jgi:hypothetical protein
MALLECIIASLLQVVGDSGTLGCAIAALGSCHSPCPNVCDRHGMNAPLKRTFTIQ